MEAKGLIAAALAAVMFAGTAVHAATKEKYTAEDGTEYYYFYSENPNHNDYLVLAYNRGTAKDIIVPDEINGEPVKVFTGYYGVTKDVVESIVLPETCISIEYFNNYPALKSVTAEGALDYITDLSGCENLETVTLKKGVKEIYPRAFQDCTSLKTVSSLNGLVSIGDHAFKHSGIKGIKLPQTLQKIGIGTFQLTPNLKNITIPENVTVIPNIAFQESGLEQVEFEGSVSFMGVTPFGGCENLRTVTGLTQDQIVKYWDAFYETPFQTEMSDDVHPFVADSKGYLAAYIGTDAEIEIPSTVKIIGDSAFALKPITSVTIPSSVTTIENKAFYGCEGLTSIIIPASVTSIKELAFSNCKNLKNITFEASDKQIAISTGAFQLTAVTADTLNTNGRRYTNQKSAFKNTALDPAYNLDLAETPEPKETEKPTATAVPQVTLTPPPTADNDGWQDTISVHNTPDKGLFMLINDTHADLGGAGIFIDENDRTQMPVRAVLELLSAKVDWNEAARTVTVTRGDNVLTLEIGSKIMYKNGDPVEMDTAAVIVNDLTYIPLRYIGEALDCMVAYTTS